MKGNVYGGVIHFPQHPDADMHGLVRACIRTQNRFQIVTAWKGFGLIFDPYRDFNSGMWSESKSHAEAIATETQYGILLVCPLVKAYLSPENYKPIPKDLLVKSDAAKVRA